MSDYQFDTSDIIVGGANITEAISCDDRLVFNESYIVTGSNLRAPSLYACYDLTVIGDVEVDDIEISGNFYVMGSIKAKKISCLKSIICSGDIDAKEIYGNEVIANDIACHSIACPGNILAKTTIDISDSLQSDRSVMAGEGILGNGTFVSKNAVAVEYFDFQGEVLGKVIEVDDVSTILRKKISEELYKAGEIDENQLVEFVKQLSKIDDDMMSDWMKLTEDLVELSYKDRITNLRDYLIIIMATKLLPKEIVGYETIEHVFNNLLIEVEKELDTLPFRAKSIADLAYALKIVILCDNEIQIDQDEALDRIFQSIGIKYKTVKSFLG